MDRETRQAIYMILTAVECYNDDPKGVGAVLEAIGEPARSIVLTGSDEQKIQAVAQALADDAKKLRIVGAMQALELEIAPLEIEEEIGKAATHPAPPAEMRVFVDKRIAELEEELEGAYEEIKKVRAENAKLRDQNKSFESALGEAQKKITSLEKKLEKEK